MQRQDHLLIAGASARGAAFSALRAGLRPWCIDLFADADLRARCPAVAVDAAAFPSTLLAAVAQAPPGPWMYTGALENHPELVDAISDTRRLWGNDARTLSLARSPQNLAAIFHRAGIPFPAVNNEVASREGSSVLVKPLKGGGGRGIRFARGGLEHGPASYLQEFMEGDAIAAAYIGDGTTAALLGVTRMLVGQPWLHAAPFAYCGSVGPLRLEGFLQRRLEAIGQALSRACGLQGLFGVDCILQGGIPWPVEVNPRYTASVEVLEYATGVHALALHRAVFAGGAALPAFSLPNATDFVGKAILFARDTVRFQGDGPWAGALAQPVSFDTLRLFADIPPDGQEIKAGNPVLTFFARADSQSRCLDTLREIARDLDHLLLSR